MTQRPEHCGRSNEDLECLGCGYKLGVIGHRRLNGEPDYCPATMVVGETKKRIEEGLRNWNDTSSTARMRFEAAKEKWDNAFKPLEEAIEASVRITEADLSIRMTI